MNPELLNEAFELLERMLLPAKLASTGVDGRGNGFRIVEYYTKNYKGREVVTPDALAKIFYEAVAQDVNQEVNGGQRGSLVWLILPKKLVAHYKALGREVVHHVYESGVKQKRVSTESAGERENNLLQLERLYDSVGYVSPRSAPLRNFLNEVGETPSINTAEALKAVNKSFLDEDYRVGVHRLQEFLAQERAR